MRLDNDAFLVALGNMFTKSRPSGSVYINMKRYDGRTKPIPKDQKHNQPNSEVFNCLIRATLGNKKISTIVSSSQIDQFSQAYSNVLKINIDGLKKRDRKQNKATGDSKRAASRIKLPALPSLREIIQIYGLKAQKQLSQNFLLQPRCIDNIVKCAGKLENSYVVEVGPGPGGITRSILQHGPPKHLVVVELDRRFLPGLEELRIFAHQLGTKMDIYRTDILKLQMDNLFPDDVISSGPNSWNINHASSGTLKKTLDLNLLNSKISKTIVIGNLPFNISTPLISQWLNNIAEKRGLWRYGRVPLVLTFQKEVAERLNAGAWHEQRSRLSVMCQTYCEVEYKKTLSGRAFSPPARVDVGVVKITPREKPLITVPYPYLHKLVKAAFAFRQKRMIRCMETLFPADRPDLIIRLFKEAAVQPMKTSFQLDNLEFRDLATVYEILCNDNPGLLDYDYQDRKNLGNWHRRRQLQSETLGHSLRLEDVLSEQRKEDSVF